MAVTRDHKDPCKFHWITQSGKKTLFGRGVFTAALGDSVVVGILATSGDKKTKSSIWITEFAYGTLAELLELGETKYLEIDPPKK